MVWPIILLKEPDVFEIDDFTTASDWERFIKSIEEILGPQGWNLDKPVTDTTLKAKPNDEWIIQSEGLKFANFHFLLMHYKLNNLKNDAIQKTPVEGLPQAVIDSFDFEYDFPTRAHCLSRWYGLKDFLILTPSNKDEDIKSLSRTNLLLSSVGIALSNLKCQLPMFIQVHKKHRLFFFGMCLGGGFRTSYEMIQLSYTPHSCNHVQGMIETFQAKLACEISAPLSITVRFTYTINTWPEELWCQDFTEPESDPLDKLPFGPLQDPIRDLQLAATWPCLSSDVLVDDANCSDLDPLHAPRWSLKARNVDFCPTLVFQHLHALLKLCQQTSDSTAQIIRSLSKDHNTGEDVEALSGDVGHVLDRLAEPVPALASPLTSVMSSATRKLIKTKLLNTPIPPKLLNRTLEHLFPDAWVTKEEAEAIQHRLDDEQKNLECDVVRMQDKYRHMKSAPVDSLTYMVAVCISFVNHSYGGISAVAHLWHEFVLELRYRLDNVILLPRLAQTAPNLNFCLFHQKLQMLNYCIKRKLEKHQDSTDNLKRTESNTSSSSHIHASVSYKDFVSDDFTNESTNKNHDTKPRDNPFSELLANIERSDSNLKTESVSYSDLKTMSDSDDSDDEFFEAREEIGTSLETLNVNRSVDDNVLEENHVPFKSDVSGTCDEKPDGVLEETKMKLLLNDEPLRIPITQEAPPLTEDMLLEQEDILTQLGTSEEAAKVRAKMQSASLVSDMASFKAANPGCILEDFVRWYSPNDWLPGMETDEEKQELKRIIQERKKENKDQKKCSSDGWEFELDDDMDILAENLDDQDYAKWTEEGHLSLRMRVPGNIWKETWNTTKRAPARLQKRLFDDTKEAEKVLHFFTSLTPSEVALHLFPVVVQSGVIRICEEDDSVEIPSLIDNIIKDTSKLYSPSPGNFKLMENIVKQIHMAEMKICRVESLRLKFSEENASATDTNEEIDTFIRSLLEKNEVVIKGGTQSSMGKLITKLLQYQKEEEDASKMPPLMVETKLEKRSVEFPRPAGREYILRTTLPRPSKTSRPSPQRLFTVITPDDFRMAGSFTQDTTFI
ncbi:rab3 GTPase-activating protein catalytic subunit-like isoform X2 [Hydractinia symbiolongicarpus]|uniref:rab3 GTPase-activating protein catalytic subunit-like isoform X2 n=1 Tax=Hydractinia symbiolongicarpus TaxID=13093 RepID=UPI00254E2AA7|nr:rab3 GTPase-activating protein catalytic subunit-like isoform X2 [Hydractinia symbiolongicarpus]